MKRSLLAILLLLAPACFLVETAHAQQVVVGNSCPASGQSAIATNGTPVLCTGSPLVWTAVGGSGGGGAPGVGSNVFNVKNFGAFGNTQAFSGTFTLGGGNTTVTCAGCSFSASDVTTPAKVIYSSGNTIGVEWFATITAVNAGVATITGFTQVGGVAGNVLVWGQLDDPAGVAITPLINAILANQTGGNGSNITNGAKGTNSQTPTVYFPSAPGGGYMLCGTSGVPSFLTLTPPAVGASVILAGDPVPGQPLLGAGAKSSASTLIYPCPNPPLVTGAWLVGSNGNPLTVAIQNIAFEGADVSFPSGRGSVVQATSLSNVSCSEMGIFNAGGQIPCLSIGTGGQIIGVTSTANAGPIQFGGNNIEVHMSRTSNGSGGGVLINNVTGAAAGSGFRWIGGQIDESGCTNAGRDSNVAVVNSYDVWFSDAGIFTCTDVTPGYSFDVDGTSQLHLVSDVVGPFSQGGGLRVQAGGRVIATDTRFYGYTNVAGNFCVNNAGTFVNLGGNRCELQYFAVTGTSAGTTATLTTVAHHLTTANIGDFIAVGQMSVAGYNCPNLPANDTNFCFQITGVPSGTTITYTTAGSNLGAGTGANVLVNTWNGGGFSGNPPVSDLTPTWNTCYITASPFAGATMCSQPNDRAQYMTRVRATSGVTTTCATPPVLTITNGNVTTTFTLTSGQSTWDTSVTPTTFPIASGSMPMYFAPTLPSGANSPTMSITTGTCATPPTNFSVTMYGNSPGLP